MTEKYESLQLLLVEDSPGDVRLTQEVFRGTNSAIELHVATDGLEAMAFLRHEGEHAASPRPHLILLDLNLPKLDGLGVLRRIRADQRTRLIPVVILSSSDEEQDRLQAYSLGANSYVRKPVDFEEFLIAAAQLGRYWLLLNESPSSRNPYDRPSL